MLSKLEATAREQRLEIWVDPQPVSPWESRATRAEQRQKRKRGQGLTLSEAAIGGATTSTVTPGAANLPSQLQQPE